MAAWVSLWGAHSETRRFKDGAIVHAVVWEAAAAARHGVVTQACRALLRRHLGVAAADVACTLRGLDLALAGVAGSGVSHTPATAIIHTFEALSRAIRGLQNLPLAILSVQPVSATFAQLEEFPPAAVPAGAPPPDGAPALRFCVQFESSGRWPDELGAIRALQLAFCLRLASQLESQHGYYCEVREPAELLVQAAGFTFVGVVHHEKEASLLAAAGRASDAGALRLRTGVGARHIASLAALSARHPAYAPAARLAKRWLSSQMLADAVWPPQLTELLAALPFVTPASRAPASAVCGFACFLRLLAAFDFGSDPVLVGVDAPLEPDERAACLAAHPEACAMLKGADAPEGGADEADADAPTKDAPAEDGEAAAAPPPPLALLPQMLGAGSPASLKRAAATLAAAACADAGNAALLVTTRVMPLLVAIARAADSGAAAAASSAVDALCRAVPSVMLWHTGTLPMGTSTADGFWAVTRDTALLSAADLAEQTDGSEVILVDAEKDAALRDAISDVASSAASIREAGGGDADVAAALATLVCERMGGAIPYESYEAYDPSDEIGRLRSESSGSRVLRLGALAAGGARHRSLLFKVLADRVGLPAALHTGNCLRGAHAHHAWATILVDGVISVVDLLHAPGSMYADSSDAARRYRRHDEFAFSSLASEGEPLFTAPPPLAASSALGMPLGGRGVTVK